ncbi:MAG: hypothetical protein LBT83_09115 [Tannerella sp.]|jgi:hypothetical protein|nr:hypothetical protein [Tannerella sp.]
MKRTILLSILALAAVISTNATTYYVKSVGGTPAVQSPVFFQIEVSVLYIHLECVDKFGNDESNKTYFITRFLI